MPKGKYSKNIIYQGTDEDVAMLEAIAENHFRSRSSMLRYLVQEEYRAMKKQEKADAEA